MPKVIMSHGAGGEAMQEFLDKHIVCHFPKFESEVPLDSMDDSAVVDGIVFTIDGHTVKPLFFPGGDLGRISVAGTVNDISVMGAEPLALGCSAIIEEGLDTDIVDRIMESAGKTSAECGVPIETGDTKVVESGAADQMFMATSAVGKRSAYLDSNFSKTKEYRSVTHNWCTDSNIAAGDAIIVSGYVGDHGIALLSFREGYGFESEVQSDVAPLNGMIKEVLKTGGTVSMKDSTRGGLANTLNELSSKSRVGIDVEYSSIPIRDAVDNACELLGIDPLSIGNEGKCVIACVPEMAEEVLKTLRKTPEGKNAAIIGRAVDSHDRVILRTEVGGRRILEPPVGDPVPRIC
ncbi:MAG: hydrogenase expression/formation protein HypE [Candidatus Methanomethylophilaceae archaeon]|jgi:hydrogenase expression/formation protein HypE